jgi:hypothetical protein
MNTYARLRGTAGDLVRDPVPWTEGIQVVKTVVATVVSWVVAAQVFGLPMPFLAPWSALLVVHATVYRTVWKGVKQVAATVLGVLTAWATGTTMGLSATSLSVMLLVALLLGKLKGLRGEGTTIAATALLVLTTGFAGDEQVLIGRLLDTAIGVVTGVAVNALVWPPLWDLTAARAIRDLEESMGQLMCDMEAELRDGCRTEDVEDWIRRSGDLEGEVDEAWALVRQARESGRLNPRRESAAVRRPGEFGEILDSTEQSLAEIRSMARTLEHSITDANEWDDGFRERWSELVCRTGRAIQERDSGRLAEVRAALGELATEYSDRDLSNLHWPEYGGLLLNLRNVATSMDRVADTDPVAVSTRGPLGRRPHA